MGTKSKNNQSIIWSIIAIIIALISIGYCFSVVLLVVENGWAHSTRLLSQIARIVGGNIG